MIFAHPALNEGWHGGVMRWWTVVWLLLMLYCVKGDFSSNWHESQRYDGWYNNLGHPDWGAVGSQLHRKVLSAYSDGVYMMEAGNTRPSARLVSDIVFKGPDGLANQRNVTAMLAFFSQVVAYEVMQSSEPSCPIEMHKIPVNKCDSTYDHDCSGETMMPFFRAKYDRDTGMAFNRPREQINDKTSWIDGSFIYSTSEPWVHSLRSFANGSLREGHMPNYPPFNAQRLPMLNPSPPHVHRLMDPERLFLLGDPRVNENPALLSFGLMFYRWHNKQAREIQRQHPDWNDYLVFERARQVVIATLQNIVMYQFIPAMLSRHVAPYTGYKVDMPPGISHIFSAAAFRFPHTLVPPGMFLRNGSCHYVTNVGGFRALRMCNTWWNAQAVMTQYSMDSVVLGMASQIAESDDAIIVEDLRDFLFGPMHFSRRDLPALTIMRGRDNGLPDYNAVRRSFHLPPRNFSQINPDDYQKRPEMYRRLEALYKNISHLDLYVGGMLESNGNGPGELFTKIIIHQFEHLRDADRFWFENRDNGLFTDEELEKIKKTTLYDIILATTNIEKEHIQKDVFFWREGDPCPQPFQVKSDVLESCIPFMRYDHFQGNEISFILTCIVLGLIPIVCAGIGYFVIRQRKRQSRAPQTWMSNVTIPTFKHKNSSASFYENAVEIDPDPDSEPIQKQSTSGVAVVPPKKFSMSVVEYLHENYSRPVSLVLYADGTLMLQKRRGSRLRAVSLAGVQTLLVTTSIEQGRHVQPTMLLMLPNEYDMVIQFDTIALFDKFQFHLRNVMASLGKGVRLVRVSTDSILASAETKERRQQKLEHFFREAYARAFKEEDMMTHDEPTHPALAPVGLGSVVNRQISEHSYLSTTLSRAEFAEALGMSESDAFVQRMFASVARRHSDKICFQEFLDMVILFSKGEMEDKMRIIYNMCQRSEHCDIHEPVNKYEFCDMLKSIITLAGTNLTDDQEDNFILSFLESHGVPVDSDYMTYQDLEVLMVDIRENNKPLGLHFKGRKQHYYNKDADRISMNSFSLPASPSRTKLGRIVHRAQAFLEDYRQEVAWLVIYFALTFALFMWKFWHYSQMSEHRDLRRVMGLGIAITRGSAAAISFSYSILLLTVCKTVITILRDTWLNQIVPFDSAITFHKIVALTALFFSAVHTVGHVINFYHISTQSQEGLRCLFQEAVFSSDFQPSITYWFFGTVTGITGILLVAALSIMYVFAAPAVVNNAYHMFRLTHFLHVAIYILSVVHGLPKLLDKPSFWRFLLGPLIVFIIDRIIQARQHFKKLEILSADLLVSDVTYVQFKRPRNFEFRSGQWVQISCPAFNCRFNEWHAFSLASAPQDCTLEVYAKAQGPWTWKLRRILYETQSKGQPYPVLHMMGPFGGGNQDWFNHRTALMVGGGIGVTPYASMLLDLVNATSKPNKYSQIACKKVYFMWVCPTHKNFEWFVDVLKQVESLDVQEVLEIHIFITQFFHKFDLRTTMLYICERHFQRVQNRSMFTGLRAKNHFGRPNMELFLKHIQSLHEKDKRIGVFSCGPGTLNIGVRNACLNVNKHRMLPQFVHRYETF